MFNPKATPPTTLEMFMLMIKLVIPSIINNMIGFSASIISRVYAGRLEDPVKIAVVGLSGSINSMLMISLMIGLNSTQDTLTS